MVRPFVAKGMCDHECARSGGSDRRKANADPSTERWLGDDSVLDADLPEDVQAALGRILGEGPVETLADWADEMRRLTGDGAIEVEDLCHADEETGHRGEMAGETYHFQCFYDAVVLSALAESPVDIRTESPDGTVIEARATGTTDLTVTPEEAVFSFGVEEAVEPPADGELSHADIYGAVCPYVRAFPDADAYERWANAVPAATVAMPLGGATELAAELAE
jgi:hypothetical protein